MLKLEKRAVHAFPASELCRRSLLLVHSHVQPPQEIFVRAGQHRNQSYFLQNRPHGRHRQDRGYGQLQRVCGTQRVLPSKRRDPCMIIRLYRPVVKGSLKLNAKCICAGLCGSCLFPSATGTCRYAATRLGTVATV